MYDHQDMDHQVIMDHIIIMDHLHRIIMEVIMDHHRIIITIIIMDVMFSKYKTKYIINFIKRRLRFKVFKSNLNLAL